MLADVCDWSTGYAYSSEVPNSTSVVSRGPGVRVCQPYEIYDIDHSFLSSRFQRSYEPQDLKDIAQFMFSLKRNNDASTGVMTITSRQHIKQYLIASDPSSLDWV